MTDKRLLRTAYGTYLSHHHGGLRTLPYPDDTCYFHFEYHHHHIAVRTHHHHFVGVDHHKTVYITDHHHESQLFTIERFPDGRIALKNHHHKTYIGVDYTGYVRAHHSIEQGELFWEEIPGAVVAPVAVAPAMAAPTYAAPAMGAPAYAAPAMGAPMYGAPTQVPMYGAPVAPVVVMSESYGHHGHHHHHHHHHHH